MRPRARPFCSRYSRRAAALSAPLKALIERRWQSRTVTQADGTTVLAELVFHRNGKRIAGFRKAWASACIGAGKERKVPSKLFHGLRRTAVRNLIRAGVPERLRGRAAYHVNRRSSGRGARMKRLRADDSDRSRTIKR